MKSNSGLEKVVLRFFIAFSCFIMLFLFFVQILFLNKYYEGYKTDQLLDIAEEIKNSELDMDNLDDISYNNGICISFYDSSTNKTKSTSYDRGCVFNNPRSDKNANQFFKNFVDSGENEHTYLLDNSDLKISTIILAMKYSDNEYIFLNTSLSPLDSSIEILKSQYIYIGVILILVSFVFGYIISKKISEPIEELSDKAYKLANGNFNVDFKTKSKISEINNLANTLENAKAELSKTNELRKDLMANVGHDLRTPLTMIKAYAEMTRDLDNQPLEKRKENMDIIISETDRLNNLVGDILDLSKLQSDTYELIIEEFDLNQLINEILNRYSILIQNEGYEFIYKNTKSIKVKADKKRIEQVIYNLINNAVNYTGDDKKVYINVISKKGNVTVEITDTGKGIEKEKLNVIWDKYYHNEKKHKRNAYGTGLGLSIVKTILETHGFEYGVKSTLNKGTTFYFVISK